jgi:hypothetical protein
VRQRHHAAMHADDHALLLPHLLCVAHWVRVIEWNVVVAVFPPETSPATSFRRRWPPRWVCVWHVGSRVPLSVEVDGRGCTAPGALHRVHSTFSATDF